MLIVSTQYIFEFGKKKKNPASVSFLFLRRISLFRASEVFGFYSAHSVMIYPLAVQFSKSYPRNFRGHKKISNLWTGSQKFALFLHTVWGVACGAVIVISSSVSSFSLTHCWVAPNQHCVQVHPTVKLTSSLSDACNPACIGCLGCIWVCVGMRACKSFWLAGITCFP